MQESMIEQSVDREKLNKKCNYIVTEQMKLQALIADLKASKTSANDEKTDMKQIKARISDFNTRVSDLELDVGIHKDSITSHSKEIQHANSTIISNGKEVQSTFRDINQMVMDLNTKMLDVQSTNNKEFDKIRSNINEVKQLLSQEIRNIKMEMNRAQPPHVAPSTIPVESATPTTHPTMPPPSTPATSVPTGTTESPLDLTMLMDYTAAAKLSLPTYNAKHSFKAWQAMSLLELANSRSPYYKSFIATDPTGNLTLNSDITMEKKKQLFSLLSKAITQANLDFMDCSTILRSDRLELWKLCEEQFAPSEKSQLEKDQLKEQFKAMQIGSKETKDDFLKRVELKANELSTYGVLLLDADKAITLLKGLKHEALKSAILAIYSKDHSYTHWIKPKNLKHTLDKAKSLLHHDASLTFGKKHTPAPAPTPATPLPASTSTIQSPPINTYKPRVQNPMLEEFETEMKAAKPGQERIDLIFKWKAKNKEVCSFHPGMSHKILSCFDFANTCQTNGWMEELAEVKIRNNAYAAKVNARATGNIGNENNALKQLEAKVAEKVAAKKATLAAGSNIGNIEDNDNDKTRSQNTESTLNTDTE